MKNIKVLHLIRGVPGSGKSTLAGIMLAGLWTRVKPEDTAGPFEADIFMVNERGEYAFDPKRLGECHAKCRGEVEIAMRRGVRHIIQSNTNILHKEMQPYLDLAAQYGYEVQEITVKANFGSVHGVPEDKLASMRARFEP